MRRVQIAILVGIASCTPIGGLASGGPDAGSDDATRSPGPDAADATLAEAREQVVRELERQYVVHLLEQHRGDPVRASAASGIGERYLRAIRARVRQA